MKLRHGGAVGDRDHGESRQPLPEQGVERLLRLSVVLSCDAPESSGRFPSAVVILRKKRTAADRSRSQCGDGKTRHVPMSMIFPLAFPLVLRLLLLLLVILVFVVELGILGSHVNIPLYAMPVERLLPAQNVVVFGRAYVAPPLQEDGVTIIAINVGGALLPLILSLYLF